jgi:hypothetical protein
MIWAAISVLLLATATVGAGIVFAIRKAWRAWF